MKHIGYLIKGAAIILSFLAVLAGAIFSISWLAEHMSVVLGLLIFVLISYFIGNFFFRDIP